MAGILFLEGPVQSGKSTLLKECLAPYRDVMGGFSCVRYRDEDGQARAYGLTSPADENVDELFDEEKTPEKPEVFMIFKSEGTEKRVEVFDSVGLELLKNCEGAKLIYLDEIGGIELMSEEFAEKIYRLLGADVPCVGVLKMNTGGGVLKTCNGRVAELNEKLRRDIVEKFGGEVISYSNEAREEIRAKVERFLADNVFAVTDSCK